MRIPVPSRRTFVDLTPDDQASYVRGIGDGSAEPMATARTLLPRWADRDKSTIETIRAHLAKRPAAVEADAEAAKLSKQLAEVDAEVERLRRLEERRDSILKRMNKAKVDDLEHWRVKLTRYLAMNPGPAILRCLAAELSGENLK